VEWVVREGWGQGGEMNQALYALMNNKRKMKKKKKRMDYVLLRFAFRSQNRYLN
jgi:hypothetical protein